MPPKGVKVVSNRVMIIKKMIAFGDSKKGSQRQENEDRFLVKAINSTSLLLAVSDGMGGSPTGGEAADDVICSLASLKNEEDNSLFLKNAINQADSVIKRRVERHPDLEGMGATATATIVTSRMAWWAHIGDSRIYLMRENALQQITRDHSFLQDLIDGGDVSRAEAAAHPMAHVLDQCVGCMDAGVDSGALPLFPGDILLVCTDGLYRSLSITEMEDIFSVSVDAEECAKQLLNKPSPEVSSDDATVIVAFV